jgi:hypothetical protein
MSYSSLLILLTCIQESTRRLLKQATYHQLYHPAGPMPSHLEQFLIETDKELENWEMDHKAEYAAAKLLGLARLERCKVEEEGQKAALKN